MTSSERTEIRITGFGGQGVVLAAHIIGHACAIVTDQHATMMQSFGPEARGSSCTATLVVSPHEVLYPYLSRSDVLVTMSADGYQTHIAELAEDGVLVYERDLVTPAPDLPQRTYGVSSTRIAESLGRSIVQNIVMVGFFAAVTPVASPEAMREAVAESVPPGTAEFNLEAFDRGLEFGLESVGLPVSQTVPRVTQER
ncbi:MAG: 2-oxoacid:acceptor oxidoreductase family protein [Acidimicrobiia bacterium]